MSEAKQVAVRPAIALLILHCLVRHGVVDDRVAGYGHLVVDECHHVSAHSFELVARRSKAKFVTGLSATVTRKDGHHPIVFMQCGPVRYRVDARQQAAARPFVHHVVVCPTGFRSGEPPGQDVRREFQRLYTALATDHHRNDLICADVLSCLREGRSPLVLTERTEHLDELARLLPSVQDIVYPSSTHESGQSIVQVVRTVSVRRKLDRLLSWFALLIDACENLRFTSL